MEELNIHYIKDTYKDLSEEYFLDQRYLFNGKGSIEEADAYLKSDPRRNSNDRCEQWWIDNDEENDSRYL